MKCRICTRETPAEFCPRCEPKKEAFLSLETCFKSAPTTLPHWILDERGEPISASAAQWACWLETAREDRIVKQEAVGCSRVSTVFLGIDHGWSSSIPILWETMILEGKMDSEMDRCGGGREQAEAMHVAMCKRVAEAQGISYQHAET